MDNTVNETQGVGAAAPTEGTQGAVPTKGASKKDSNYFSVVYLTLLDAMTIRQDTVLNQSKSIEQNAQEQDSLNKANSEIKFSVLPPSAKQSTINRVQDQNEVYAQERQNIQNKLITARQSAQVQMTEAGTNVQILQQDASMNSGIINELGQVYTVIDQISQPSQ